MVPTMTTQCAGGRVTCSQLLFVLSFLVAGDCLAAVPVGSVAIYSDGRVEKLLAIEEGNLRWEDDRKRQFVRSPNPVVPALTRIDFLSKRGYQQRVSSGDPDALLEASAGTPVEFSVTRVQHDGVRSVRHWECVLEGTTQDRIAGKVRELDQYVCERFTIHRKFWHREFREKREFSYSPDLGLVVDLRRQTRTKSYRRKLVKLLPPDKASYKRITRTLKKLRPQR